MWDVTEEKGQVKVGYCRWEGSRKSLTLSALSFPGIAGHVHSF